MKCPLLRGLRFANWGRRSDTVQDTSIGDQLEVNNNFAADHEMVHVTDFILEASGSVPGARDDIPEVIATCVKEKVDVLLLHDVSRLTRSGIEHGMKVLYDIKAAGLQVVFVRDDIPGGEWAPIFQTLLLFAANQFSKKLADTSARSSQLALEDNRIPVAKLTPYGIDRLVTDLHDEPLFRVRNIDGNIQQRLHPTEETILEEFRPNEKGKRGFYSKQKTEKVYWVPGEKKRTENVLWMFQRFFADGATLATIRKELKEKCVLTPNGNKVWRSRSLRQLLRNPAFTGRALANSYTQAVYAMRGKGGAPVASNVDFKTLANRRKPPRVRRPERDWHWREEPYLKDFLPPDLKIVVEEYHRKCLDQIKNGYVPKSGGDPHKDSPYVLKNLLHAATGEPLVGQGNGRKGRFYGAKYEEGKRRRFVLAEAVEATVLREVKEVLLSDAELRGKVLHFVKKESAEATQAQRDIESICKQQKSLECKIEFLIDRVTHETQALTERKIREAEEELSVINRKLRQAEGEVPKALLDVDGAANAVVRQLGRLGESIEAQSFTSLNRLLGHLIEDLKIDLETYRIDMKLRLPATTVWTAYETAGDGCVLATVGPNFNKYTTNAKAIPLATLTCTAKGKYHQRCWTCRRRGSLDMGEMRLVA